MKYAVISPVRNEGKHLQQTVDSMIQQTIPPVEWILVDDGSSDNTLEIIEEAARCKPWIRLVSRTDRGSRKSGAGVVEAFYDGFRELSSEDWESIVKLDGDLAFPPNYFERALQSLAADPKLGIVGGDICHYESDELVLESKNDPEFHVRGATKIYRRECWNEIGGLVSLTGWDTLDEVKANMLGWKTGRIPELQLIHLKPTGAADGAYRNGFKNGRGSFICGYHPLFLLARCAKRLLGVSPFVESTGLFAGFFSSYFTGVERVKDKELMRFMRKQQLRRMAGLPSLWT